MKEKWKRGASEPGYSRITGCRAHRGSGDHMVWAGRLRYGRESESLTGRPYDSPAVFPFFGGFTIGYLMYDYIHFHTHFGQSRSRLAKSLRRRHLQHHFACPDRLYGVSSPLWDYVFRTHLRRGERPAQSR